MISISLKIYHFKKELCPFIWWSLWTILIHVLCRYGPDSGGRQRGKVKAKIYSNEYNIKRAVLSPDYDKTSRPVMNDSTTVTVFVGMSLFHILDTVSSFRWRSEYVLSKCECHRIKFYQCEKNTLKELKPKTSFYGSSLIFPCCYNKLIRSN